jgi:hypothetical protein
MRNSTPGEGLLHPIPGVAMGLFALNDHLLKSLHPSFWTGKLSDLAGLVFFPLLLQGFWEAALALAGRRTAPCFRAWGVCAGVTALVFTAIQIHSGAAQAWCTGLGLAQWPFRAMWALSQGAHLPLPTPVQHTMDPTDLWALPFLLLGGWAARTRAAPFDTGAAELR